MLTVEGAFKREMEVLWTGDGGLMTVACTVSAPDERWVSEATGTRAAVIATDFEIRGGVGRGAWDEGKRKRGKCAFVLEVRVKTDNAAEELLVRCAEFVEHFHLGLVVEEFQVTGPIRGSRVRANRGGPRITEMVMLVPVTGPFEVDETRYDIETVTAEVEVEGETVETGILPEPGD